MPQALLFDESGVALEIASGLATITESMEDKFVWTHLRPGDDIRQILPEEVDRSHAFTEDLLEEQRPRVAMYQTLEDNEDTFSVVVLSLPTPRIFSEDEFQVQVSFVLIDSRLFSASSTERNMFSEIMSKILTSKKQYTPTLLFNYIISELLEMSIDVLEQIEDHIDHIERKQLSGGLKRGTLASLLALKGRLFDASKMIKADLEHIFELRTGHIPELDKEEMGDHLEDRALYLQDLIEAAREDLTNMINLHLAIASNVMNRQFYWLTIIGSLLIIPTIISSIWGMNLTDLPDVKFEYMMLLILISTLISGFLVKLFLPKPLLN
ncbi:MAG: magnesium transporter CorA family protein [Candidatus Kariarchaeaceae archaeon]|jgi:magnesium transporter